MTVSFTTGAAQPSGESYVNGLYGTGAYYADEHQLRPTRPGGTQHPERAPTCVQRRSPGRQHQQRRVTGYGAYRDATLATSVTGTATARTSTRRQLRGTATAGRQLRTPPLTGRRLPLGGTTPPPVCHPKSLVYVRPALTTWSRRSTQT
ncbi:hypothetical protein [Streptomyces sp. NPDC055709]